MLASLDVHLRERHTVIDGVMISTSYAGHASPQPGWLLEWDSRTQRRARAGLIIAISAAKQDQFTTHFIWFYCLRSQGEGNGVNRQQGTFLHFYKKSVVKRFFLYLRQCRGFWPRGLCSLGGAFLYGVCVCVCVHARPLVSESCLI